MHIAQFHQVVNLATPQVTHFCVLFATVVPLFIPSKPLLLQLETLNAPLTELFPGKNVYYFQAHGLMRLFCRIRNMIGVQVAKRSLGNRQHKWTWPCALFKNFEGFCGFLHFHVKSTGSIRCAYYHMKLGSFSLLFILEGQKLQKGPRGSQIDR